MRAKTTTYLFILLPLVLACLWLTSCATSSVSPSAKADVVEWGRTSRPTPTPEPSAGATRVWGKDDSIMVYVPSGEFVMGITEDDDSTWFDNERPRHSVHVSAFWIDQMEVTNAQYRRCVENGHCEPPPPCNAMDLSEDAYSDSEKSDHPVVCVSWEDAVGYCKWVGKQLPTEAEWEKACRGTDGRLRPWGDEWDPAKANTMHALLRRSAAVGSYPEGASPYGALNMIGNAEEWVWDWYDP